MLLTTSFKLLVVMMNEIFHHNFFVTNVSFLSRFLYKRLVDCLLLGGGWKKGMAPLQKEKDFFKKRCIFLEDSLESIVKNYSRKIANQDD